MTTAALARAYAAAGAASYGVTPPEGVSTADWLEEHGTLAFRHGMVHAGIAAALDDVDGVAGVIDPLIAEPARSRVLAAWNDAGLDAAVLMAEREADARGRAARLREFLLGPPHTRDSDDADTAEVLEPGARP